MNLMSYYLVVMLGINWLFMVTNVSADSGQLISGIDTDKLLSEISSSFYKSQEKVTNNGIEYLVEDSMNNNKVKVTLAVYGTKSQAIQAIRTEALFIALPPTTIKSDIGDVLYCWLSKSVGGTMLVQRNNVVFRVASSDISFEEIKIISKKIDTVIESSNEIVNRSDTVLTPKPKKTTILGNVAISSESNFTVEFENVDGEYFLGSQETNIICKGNKVIKYYAKKEEGVDTINIVVATKKNVLSKLTLNVNVVSGVGQ